MTLENIKGSELKQSFPQEVIKEVTEQGQVVWLKSAPEDKPVEATSSLQSQSQED